MTEKEIKDFMKEVERLLKMINSKLKTLVDAQPSSE